MESEIKERKVEEGAENKAVMSAAGCGSFPPWKRTPAESAGSR